MFSSQWRVLTLLRVIRWQIRATASPIEPPSPQNQTSSPARKHPSPRNKTSPPQLKPLSARNNATLPPEKAHIPAKRNYPSRRFVPPPPAKPTSSPRKKTSSPESKPLLARIRACERSVIGAEIGAERAKNRMSGNGAVSGRLKK